MFKAILNNCLDEKKWKKRTPLILLPIFFYGMYLRLIELAGHEITGDEHWQLNQMHGSFKELWDGLPKNEFCSYLSGDYYLTYPFFKIFGYNKWGLAIPHIISTLIGFYLLYCICRLLFKTPVGSIISFLIVCFNANLIDYATRVRVYAVLPTLAMAAFLIIHNMMARNERIRGVQRGLLDILLMVTILFHAYGVLIVFFPLIYLVWDHRGEKDYLQSLKFLVKHLLIVGVVTMPLWIYSVFGPHLNWDPIMSHKGPATFFFIPNPAENMIGFLKGVFGNLVGFKKFYVFLLGGAGLLFIPYSFSEKCRQIAFLLVLVFFPIGLILVSDIRNNYWFIQRQFIWVIPFFALFLGWVWDSIIVWGLERWK